MNDDDLEDADIETFIRLLKEAPRTYVDLMAITNMSFRTCKERLRVIRQTHEVEEVWLPVTAGSSGRGPMLMHIRTALPMSATTACPIHKGSRCMHCDGSGRVPKRRPGDPATRLSAR